MFFFKRLTTSDAKPGWPLRYISITNRYSVMRKTRREKERERRKEHKKYMYIYLFKKNSDVFTAMKLELPGDAGDLIRGHGNEYKLRRSKQPITNPGLLVKQHSPRCGQASKPDASKSTTAVLDSPFPGTLPVGHFLTCASTTWETPVVETNEIRSNIKYRIIVFFSKIYIYTIYK